MAGTNADYFDELKRRVRNATRHYEIVDAVMDYWNHPDNVAAREQGETGEDTAKHVLEYVADMALSFNEYLDDLTNYARKDPLAYDLLGKVLATRLESGRLSEYTTVSALLRGEMKRPTRRGTRPTLAVHHTRLQAALAVRAVYEATDGKYSLAARDNGAPESAYGVVSEATELEFNTVKDYASSIKPRVRVRK